MIAVSRYHPLLVTLHWLLAFLIIASMSIGFFLLPAMSNAEPRKLDILMLHMAGGMLILALTVIRFIVRLRTRRPAELSTGRPVLDAVRPLCHYAFYVLVVLMVATGYTTAILAGLNKIVFMKSGTPLPADLTVYPTFVAHALLAVLFANLVVLHVLAAVYHQFIRKDGIMRRMSFGSRTSLRSMESEQLSERSGGDRA